MNIKCTLCPKYCLIPPNKRGDCKVRININGKLTSVVYSHPVAIHIDPIEKKPLFHFLPGSKIFSLATAGCNLHCKNCQNWEISQTNPENLDSYYLKPKQLINEAIKARSKSLAYTYTDPIIYYEYALECAEIAQTKGLHNVLVTAGYINQAPLKKLLKFVSAANIDLKSISNQFYKQICDASLRPVLDTLITVKKENVHLEVTNLLIPGLNDSENDIKKLVTWIKNNLGYDTPLHFSRFHPTYKMKNLPFTSSKTLIQARNIAIASGLPYTYIGNYHTLEGENTICPKCNNLLIKRSGYTILKNNIVKGCCKKCLRKVEGVWAEENL